ncbi:MAG: L-threo-3-deoxy-hexylosonate aldolase [Stictis urceolatum]|nr:L-threo-3-deoxy-hexylosonate aldolase [Stictis urceolata]
MGSNTENVSLGGVNGANGVQLEVRRVPMAHGIYSPTMTFFDPDTEDVDLPTVARHSVRLAKAGLAGLITMGSNGEAVHLTREERTMVTKATREALDNAGFSHIPVICGASEQSIRGTIQLCKEGAAAGASYALIVPPSYFRAAMDESRLEEYFIGVADGSPIPLILYNYPGAVAGIDMDSDFIIKVSQHPNIVGTKFTCGNTGKLTRVALATDALTTTSQGSGYMALGGMADFTLQTAVSGGSGIIAGGANVLPRTCVKVWQLWQEGKLEEAMQLQKVLSKGDWVLTKAAVPGTKQAIQFGYGYGGYPRRPLRRLKEEEVKKLGESIAEVMKVEMSLPDFGVPAEA